MHTATHIKKPSAKSPNSSIKGMPPFSISAETVFTAPDIYLTAKSSTPAPPENIISTPHKNRQSDMGVGEGVASLGNMERAPSASSPYSSIFALVPSIFAMRIILSVSGVSSPLSHFSHSSVSMPSFFAAPSAVSFYFSLYFFILSEVFKGDLSFYCFAYCTIHRPSFPYVFQKSLTG